MHKKKISKKLVKSSKEKALTNTRYKAGTDVSISGLKEAYTEALFEADYDTFKGCIAILLDKCDYSEITKKLAYQKVLFIECVSRTLIQR